MLHKYTLHSKEYEPRNFSSHEEAQGWKRNNDVNNDGTCNKRFGFQICKAFRPVIVSVEINGNLFVQVPCFY